MNKLLLTACGVVLICSLSLGASAQITKGKTRILTTKQLMGGLVRPCSAGLAEGLKQAPEDEKGWEELATKAALLNEASYLMMDDGRCPDAVWKEAAEMLRTASNDLAAKLEATDLAAAQEAYKGVTAACASCHKAHKK